MDVFCSIRNRFVRSINIISSSSLAPPASCGSFAECSVVFLHVYLLTADHRFVGEFWEACSVQTGIRRLLVFLLCAD